MTNKPAAKASDTGPKASDTSPKTSDTSPADDAKTVSAPVTSDTGMVGDVTPEAKEPTKSAQRRKAEDGRPACRIHDVFDTVRECSRPEFDEDAGLCNAHWALFPNARKAAARD